MKKTRKLKTRKAPLRLALTHSSQLRSVLFQDKSGHGVKPVVKNKKTKQKTITITTKKNNRVEISGRT